MASSPGAAIAAALAATWLACTTQTPQAGVPGAAPGSASTPAAPPALAGSPATPGPAREDPLLAKVCAAYDAEVATDPSTDRILARTAVRAVREQGVTEAELQVLGAAPASLLQSIRQRGNPPACAGLAGALERMAAAP